MTDTASDWKPCTPESHDKDNREVLLYRRPSTGGPLEIGKWDGTKWCQKNGSALPRPEECSWMHILGPQPIKRSP